MTENELDEMMKLDEHAVEQERIEKRIKTGVTKNIYMRIFIVLLISCIVIFGGYYGISLISKKTNYNPLNENSFVDITSLYPEEELDDSGFNILMQTFISMYYPGYHYLGGQYTQSGDLYEMSGQLHNSFNRLYVGGSNCTWTIQKSKLTFDAGSDDNLNRIANEYHANDFQEDYDILKLTSETLQDIKNLPDSSILEVSISFPKIKNAQEISDFIKKYNDSNFSWIALKNENKQVADGMSLYDPGRYVLTTEAQKKYPQFYLDGNTYSANQLLQNYKSKLALLLDSKDFLSLISTYNRDANYVAIQERKQRVDTNGIEATGIKGYIEKNQLLKIIENEKIEHLFIKDVKLSILER